MEISTITFRGVRRQKTKNIRSVEMIRSETSYVISNLTFSFNQQQNEDCKAVQIKKSSFINPLHYNTHRHLRHAQRHVFF